MKGKLQINNGINILVETENSSNTSIWHKNIPIVVTKVLSDQEIIQKAMEIMKGKTKEELLAMSKDILKSIPGYATSNCKPKVGNEYGQSSIVEYKEVLKEGDRVYVSFVNKAYEDSPYIGIIYKVLPRNTPSPSKFDHTVMVMKESTKDDKKPYTVQLDPSWVTKL